MSSPPDNAAPPHSVFLSYASADRAAARSLRDTLAQAGLDVWLDEEELAGGEAWDAKIRQQIRSCTYFMPVISATTEARREGYFRREWRFAVERTLDLADDVLFLVPVVIDETPEPGARVPEKFLSVQWLRCPGGRETPALVALAQRLANGDTAIPAPPPVAADSRSSRRARRSAARDARVPPFPPFPTFPAPGHRAHFVYELIVWLGRTLYRLWQHLPRWIRWMLVAALAFKLVGWIGRSSDKEEPVSPQDTAQAVDLGQLFSDAGNGSGLKFLRAAGIALDALQGNRPVAVVAFNVADPSLREAASRAFISLHQQIVGTDHATQVAVSVEPLPAGNDDLAALVRATSLKCHWLLTGYVRLAADGQFTLDLKLYDATAAKLAWQTARTGEIPAAAAVGESLGREALEHLTFEPVPAK